MQHKDAYQVVIDIHPGRSDPACAEPIALGGQVLLVGGTAGIGDEKRRLGAPLRAGPGRHRAATSDSGGSRSLTGTGSRTGQGYFTGDRLVPECLT